jgi:SAM-dependent methyltransferase
MAAVCLAHPHDAAHGPAPHLTGYGCSLLAEQPAHPEVFPVRLYSELAPWYPVLTAAADYADEAADYTNLIVAALPGARTLLELGAGAGANASHMKAHFTCTLTDISPEMLALSRALNPECEHIEGDMRTLRLGRTFDAVFVHDAIGYMVTLEDLERAMVTAFVHTRPGGVALFLPDHTTETGHGGHDNADGRSLRYIEWMLRPPSGSGMGILHFVMVMKDSEGVRVEHDIHQYGLFTHAEWVAALERVGFVVESPALDPATHEAQVAFLCRRP